MQPDPRELVPNLQYLRYFIAVVDERSFTRAADRLGVSQPVLSRQIALLEGQLGISLLERTPTGVVPTAIGRDVLAEARLALASAQRVARVAREAMQLQVGSLEIATYPSLATGTLLPAIRRWHERYPNVTLRVSEFRDQRALLEAVRLGVSDLAIGTVPGDWQGAQAVLGINEFVVVLPDRDVLLEQARSIRLDQLTDRQWVLYDRSYGLSDLVNAACALAGFRPAPTIETSQVEAAARLAAAGMGPALVPRANVPAELAGMSRPLEPAVVWEIRAFARLRWSAAARAFLDIVAEDPWPAAPADARTIEVPAG